MSSGPFSPSDAMATRSSVANSIASIWHQRRIILLTLIVNFGALLFGYDSGIAGAAIVLPSFQESFGIRGSPEQVADVSSNIVSILYGGAFFGAILASVISFHFGRRAALLNGCVFFIVGGIVQTTSRHVASIYVGRLLAGFGIGAVSQVCPIYVGECASKQHRSRAVATFQMCLVTGGMLAYWIGYSSSVNIADDSSRQWKVPLGIQLLPGGLFTIGLFFVPESPRFLAYQQIKRERASTDGEASRRKERFPDEAGGIASPIKDGGAFSPVDLPSLNPTSPSSQATYRKESLLTTSPLEPYQIPLYGALISHLLPGHPPKTELAYLQEYPALSTLAYLRQLPLNSMALHEEMAEVFAQLDEIEQERAVGGGKWAQLLRKPSNQRRLIVAAFVGTWQIWIAETAILYYAPTIFQSIGFSSNSTSLLASGVFTCLKVTSTIIALAVTVNRYGRVTGMAWGGITQGTMFFIIGIVLATHPVDPNASSPSPASLAMMALIYIYVILYSFTLGPLPWVYASEIFPVHLRDAGQLVFILLTWANNYAVAKLTPIGFTKIGWKLWLIYGSFNLGGAIICWMLCPETKGKSIEEIDIIFGSITERERADHVDQILHHVEESPEKK